MSANFREKVLETAQAYNIACGVGCKVIDPSGSVQASFQGVGEKDLCATLTGKGQLGSDCRKSYLYGGFQGEKLGHYYIYFCPFGLGNWAVPVYAKKAVRFYLVGGPVLLHPVDRFLLEDIFRRNPGLECSPQRLRSKLAGIPAVDPRRVRYLAEVLFALAQTLMPKERPLLEERHHFHLLSGKIVGEKPCGHSPVFQLENKLIAAVKIGDQSQAGETLNEILGHIYFDNSGFKHKKNRLIALMAVLARAAVEAGADLEVIFGLEYHYLQKMEETNELMELSTLLVRVLERFIECSFSLRTVKNKDLIFKAMNFIRNNFGEDISLEDVAREVGLHPSYFSKLFREELEMTYTNYLQRVRIENAKILIGQDCPLAEAAQVVGFNDQSYFSKIFKKIEGITPGRWRAQRG